MNRLIVLIRQFNKPLLLCNLAFSVIGIVFIVKNGIGAIGNSLSLKAAGYVCTTLYQYYMSNKSYFYFRNAGYSIRRMYGYVYSIDFLFYIILILLYSLIYYAFIKG